MGWDEREKQIGGGVLIALIAIVLLLVGAAIGFSKLELHGGRFVVDVQLGWTLAVVALLGATGGLAYDITEPLRPAKTWRAASFENRTAVPSLKASSGVLDWGFLGPMLVGAVAALVVTFLIGLQYLPDDDPTTPGAGYITLGRLIFIPTLSGFAGSLVLRVLRSRLAAALRITELTEAASSARTALASDDEKQKEVAKARLETALAPE